MNDEQQFWRDVQKFMNQFPGFVSVARKIGEIGDLETWQANEQRKLEAITQEVEKQRAVIVSEREAANVEATRRLRESEAKLSEHAELMSRAKADIETEAKTVLGRAGQDAAKIMTDAKAKAKEITDVVEPKKAALEAEIAALMDKMLAVKSEHEAAKGYLEKVKDDHASFLKKILGTAGG